jgi:hypothetical protein
MACGMTAVADKTHRANVSERYELTHEFDIFPNFNNVKGSLLFNEINETCPYCKQLMYVHGNATPLLWTPLGYSLEGMQPGNLLIQI